MILCYCTLVDTQGWIITFQALDEIFIDDYTKTMKYSIYFNEEECKLTCTCVLFEMRVVDMY